MLSDGSFAIGTISAGIFILDKNGKVKYHINQNKGLSNNTALSLFEDSDNNLWIATYNGLLRFNTQTFATSVFTTNDGLNNNEFNRTSSFKAADGTIYFGGLDAKSFFFEKSAKKPNECRLNGSDYESVLKVNVYVEIIENNEIISKKNYQLGLLNIPVMLHSSLCVLNGLDAPQLKESGECIYEKGGYFIVGGLEKVIVTQERPAINYIQVQEINEEPYSWRADVRSREEGSAQVPQATYVKYNAKTRTYWVLVPYIKILVPLCVIFRALGIETDKDIANLICGNDMSLESSKMISDMLVPSLNEGSVFYTQKSALKFLASLTTVQPDKGGYWKENILRILSKKMFPHSNHESNKFIYKAVYFYSCTA